MSAHHAVQFFALDDPAYLQSIVAYVAEGIETGEPVVLATSAQRRDDLYAALERLGIDCESAVEDGRLVFLESDALISRILVKDRIDGYAFDAAVGRELKGIVARSRSRRVRVYGDVVGDLWQRGRRSAAVELERYWNDLQGRIPFDLFCGYPIDVFGDGFLAGAIDGVLCQHAHVVPHHRNREMQSALDFAMYETIGRNASSIDGAVKDQVAADWPELPAAEATILWIREFLPAYADEILRRAKRYSQAWA